MTNILDRYIFRSLIVNYAIALGVMISLYVLFDLFINMDEFTEAGHSLSTVLTNMADYYAPNLLLYFAQLSGAITLFACLATVARMRRLNEMSAMLASGVSLYRVARPVLVFGVMMTGLMVIDTEWLIPRVAHKLARDHDDVDGKRAYEVYFVRDQKGDLLSAGRFLPRSSDLQRLLVLSRDENGAIIRTLEADAATWVPPGSTRPHGYWKLERGRSLSRVLHKQPGLGPREEMKITYPTEYETDLSPDLIQLRQSEGWVGFLSLAQLRELAVQDSPDRDNVLRTRHARVVGPIVGIIILLLGLPFFLDRSADNVLADAGKCLAVCGLCYVVAFISQSIRAETHPALFAWIPIFVFGTLAMVMFDRLKT